MITKCPWPDLFAVVGTTKYCEALADMLRRCGWSTDEIALELAEVRAAMAAEQDGDEQAFAI